MLTFRDTLIIEFCNTYGGITINQAAKIFFKDIKYSYDGARKRLKTLLTNGVIKYTETWNCNERIYTTTKKTISAHDLKLLDVYAALVELNCEILEFQREKEFMEGAIRSDGFIHAKTKSGSEFIMAIEIDFTHQTDLSKYELLYHSQEPQEMYGAFPIVLIVNDGSRKYTSKDFTVHKISHDLKDLANLVQF